MTGAPEAERDPTAAGGALARLALPLGLGDAYGLLVYYSLPLEKNKLARQDI